MADTLRIKRRLAGGAAGAPASLAAAELAYNEQDDSLWYGKGNNSGAATSIVKVGGLGNFLPLSGGTMFGQLTMGTNTVAVNTYFNGAAGQYGRNTLYMTAGASRWLIGVDGVAESPANSGSNFVLAAYNDAGAAVGNALYASRATGLITVIGDPTAALGIATKQYVDGKVGGIAEAPSDSFSYARRNAAWNKVLPLTGGTLTGSLFMNAQLSVGTNTLAQAMFRNGAAGQYRETLYMTAGNSRWDYGVDATAESGNDAGSNFFLQNYLDSGAAASIMPLFITRKTGVVAFGATPTFPTPTAGDNSTQGATTAFVTTAVSAVGGGAYLPLTGGTITGELVINDNVTTVASASQSISATSNAQGAGLMLIGNGATTPAKTIRARNGAFEIVNHAYNSIPLTLADNGALSLNHTDSAGLYTLTLSNTVTANGVGLRFVGPGATTPNKTLRVTNGLFQIINSAYTAAILGLSDNGRLLVGLSAADDGSTALQVTGSALVSSFLGLGSAVPSDATVNTLRIGTTGIQSADQSVPAILQVAANAYQVSAGGAWKYLTANGATVVSNRPADGSWGWYGAVSGAAGGTISWLQRMVLDGTGLTVSGGMVTVTASGSTYPTLQLSAPSTAAVGSTISGTRNNVGRWQLQMPNGGTEGAGNVGGDFGLYRYANDGTYLGNPLLIIRSTGIARFAQEVQSTAGGPCFRLAGQSIGTMLYSDSTNFYFLLTNSSDQFGSYNSLRPFNINLTSGRVYMGNGLTITAGGLNVDSGDVQVTGSLYTSVALQSNGGDLRCRDSSFRLWWDGGRFKYILFSSDSWAFRWDTSNGAFAFQNPSGTVLFQCDGGGGLYSLSNCSIGTTLTAGSTITSNNGRIISKANANNVSVCCYDTAGYAAGMFLGASSGGTLYLGNMDGNGGYAGPWYLACTAATVITNGTLGVNGTGTSNFSGTIQCSGSSIGVRYTSGNWNSGNTFLLGWYSYVAGSVHASVDNGGAVVAFANASDARLKLNIVDSTHDALDTVNALRTRQFEWLKLPEPRGLREARERAEIHERSVGVRVGLVAQEVNEIFPEGVVRGDDTEDMLGLVWTLDTNVMHGLLIKAVQQLTARVQALEDRPGPPLPMPA